MFEMNSIFIGEVVGSGPCNGVEAWFEKEDRTSVKKETP
jgi:hypothetical protein